MPQTRQPQASEKSQTAKPAARKTAPQAAGPALLAPLSLQLALADPLSASPEQVLQLQRQYGNRAVQRLVQRAEAEKMQRDSAVGLEGGVVEGDLQNQINSARGGGQPLDRTAGSQIGGALGADLSGVRVHTDSKSDTLNRSLSAKAFTLGSDVFFSRGAYNPGTSSGQQLLAHELTHVVQQGGGKTNKVQTKLTVGPAGDKYEQEADRVATQVALGPAALVFMPQTDGQLRQAQREVVQRDLISPGQVAKPSWTVSRPKVIQAIDTALGQLANKMMTLPGAIDDIKKLITGVLKAISDFLSSKDSGGKWDTNVKALESEVKQKEKEIDDKILDREQGVVKFAEYQTLEPDLAQYAKRSQLTASNFKPSEMATIAGPSVKTALTLPRGPHGELTPQAIAEMTQTQQEDIDKEKDTTGRDLTLGGLKIDEIRQFMDAHKNALTGKTEYPELQNITDPLDPLTNPDNVVTTPVTMNGVVMQVEHNQSDVNFTERLKLVTDAVAKIASKGITVPALNIHMPKYGRGIKVAAGSGASGQPSCTVENKSSRAVFISPNFMHLSSEIIGTPNLTQVTNTVTKAKEYQFSSTGFDPSGVATIVHEFGHALHFASAPGKFHGLWGTGFKGAQEENIATSQVSQYGNKPREFVAEVFLGLMYYKAYSDEVLKMYKAFGGFIPPAMAGKFALL